MTLILDIICYSFQTFKNRASRPRHFDLIYDIMILKVKKFSQCDPPNLKEIKNISKKLPNINVNEHRPLQIEYHNTKCNFKHNKMNSKGSPTV